MTIDEYLDRALLGRGLRSDHQLAAALGLSRGTVNQWRTRRTWPGDEAMIALAELAGADAKVALADLNTWRAKSERARRLYSEWRQALGCLLLAAVLLGALLAAPANAAGTSWRARSPIYTLCDIGRRALHRWRRLSSAFSGRIAALIPAEPRCAA